MTWFREAHGVFLVFKSAAVHTVADDIVIPSYVLMATKFYWLNLCGIKMVWTILWAQRF